ncbi:3-hydroxyisobutyrate dehydrogenase [Actinacidiphila yanglinensis]|uniref:3-hydroxyisobutyrate dehydrogenase n=1 Tax=Actinacidiphila yanglinensis TaxID=310779 RepID=A0A1H6C4K2_9ACTN|nr:NAD(P)-dependent oxidoreductase [Actinacidiphila yanglinensis]SEG67833.1 3-hydroxyisobutyrate dehydrogenase [Actinacidiphila yanglinensis]
MSENQGGVAFVGLGRMGLPMASQLVRAGVPTVGFDVGPAARESFAAAGGAVADSAAAAVAGAATVILMLPDSGVVESVLGDPEVVAALRPGTTVVDMSSSEPARTRALAGKLVGLGVAMVDAPVSGGVARAGTGELAVMVGGEDTDVARVEPLLTRLGTLYRSGGIGSGHAVKALNNLMSATHLLVTSEAVLAGRRFGLDPARVLEIVNASSGRSGSSENKWPRFVLPGSYDSGFGLRLMLKDMRIAVALAEQVGLPSRLGADAVEVWARAAEELPADADHTEIARWLDEHAPPPAGA